MGKTKNTREQVLAAIEGTAGIKSTIARKLGVSRPTFDKYLKRWKSVFEAYEAERSRVDDVAVSVVVKDIIQAENVDTAKWWLKMKMGDEFKPKQQIEVNVGDVDSAIKDELEKLADRTQAGDAESPATTE